MKHYLRIALVIFILSISGGMALASDVTGASFYGIIQATNNTTIASNVCVPFMTNTASLISAGILNSTASNVAIQSDTGIDTAFMIGYGANPSIVFYDSIPANSNRSTTIYTGNAIGGKPALFGTMAVSDNDTNLEVSSNGSISWTGYVPSTNTFLWVKPGAIGLQRVGGNVTASIYSTTPTWVSPTSNTANGWTNPTYAYDSDNTSYANYNVDPMDWSPYLELGITPTYIDSMRFYCSGANIDINQISVDMLYGGSFHNIYEGAFTIASWTTKTIATGYQLVSGMRIKLANANGSLNTQAYICEAQFGAQTPVVSVSHAITSGDKTINVGLSGPYLGMTFDGGGYLADLSGNVTPNTTSNWIFGSDDTPYITACSIAIGGNLRGSWVWQYGVTFADLSGNGNTATPTFRTTSSNANVSANLTSFLPMHPAKANSVIISSWPSMVTAVPNQPSTTYTENSTPGIFFAPLIHDIWPSSTIPESFFWYGFTFFTIIVSGLLIFWAFASKGQSALLIKVILMSAIMIFWSLPGPNVYGMYVFLYFIMWCFGIMVLSRSYGW
jgi:hypothetical protein